MKSLALADSFLRVHEQKEGKVALCYKPQSSEMPKSREVSCRNVVIPHPGPSITRSDSTAQRDGAEERQTLPYGITGIGSFLKSAV